MKKVICGAMLLASLQSTSAAQMFNGRDFTGWELKTTPTATIDQVFSHQAGGVIAVTGQPARGMALERQTR